MDQQAKEVLAIFMNVFCKLENRRKGLSVIEKRMQEDIEQCVKRRNEAITTKKRVPFYSPQVDLPITLEEEQPKKKGKRGRKRKDKVTLPITLEEEQPKETGKRGRKRKDENAASENISEVKILTKSRHRKRASDDDLVEEQPVSKRRGNAESNVNQQDTPKKVLRSKHTFSEKRSILEKVDNVLEEKENNIPVNIDLINSNGAILKTKTLNHQVLEGEKPLVEMDKSSEVRKNPNGGLNNGETVAENSGQSSTFVKSKTDKTIIDREETVKVTRTKISINLEDNMFKIHQNNGTKLLKTINLTLSKTIELSSDEEDEENLEKVDSKQKKNTLKNRTVTKDFVVPPLPTVVNGNGANAASSKSSSDEGSPVQNPRRFTRSKSKAIKGKEQVCPPSSSEMSSTEDSPVKKQSKIVKAKELPVSSSSVENVTMSADEAPVPAPRITRSKMAKPKEQPKSNLNDRNPSPPAEEEVAPAPRITRSKMAKPKKDKNDAAERSGEESDAKREFQSFSDSELGKKKVKDIVKMLNEKQAMVLLSPVPITKEQEKENHHNVGGIMKMLEKKEKITPIMARRLVKTTPLQVRNGYITPNKKPPPIISSATRNKSVMDDVEKRRKEEEARLKRLKEEEVLRKKQEMIKIKQEELKRKHEEKMLKAAAMREAAEKEKTEVILKLEKEREEREKMAKAEIERKKMEEALKKKMANQTKAAEVESRRLREEAARAAKLKEMEEEQRQHEELRQKQLEENERIMKMRQEDQRAKEISKQKLLYQKEMQKKLKANVVPLKDKDNYSITGDLLADEESDDMEEENSKKEIPSWAKREERLLPSKIQVHYPISLVTEFFGCPSSSPDLTDIFGKMTMKRIRSSSAVWLDSPPLKVFQPINN